MALINQQEVINAIEKCHKRCCRMDSNGDEWIHYETALNEVESIKPIQEIIHCKDCVNWDTSWYTNDGNHFCPMIDMATEKNFFCKYGEER